MQTAPTRSCSIPLGFRGGVPWASLVSVSLGKNCNCRAENHTCRHFVSGFPCESVSEKPHGNLTHRFRRTDASISSADLRREFIRADPRVRGCTSDPAGAIPTFLSNLHCNSWRKEQAVGKTSGAEDRIRLFGEKRSAPAGSNGGR